MIKQYIWLKFLIIIKLNLINCYGELNDTEFELCYNLTLPKHTNNCTYFNNQFKSIACCFFNMSYPDHTTLCVPLSRNSLFSNGKVSTILPHNIEMKGYYHCNMYFLKINYFIFYYILIIL